MILDAEYAAFQGKSVLVPGEPESERGQCVQWADYVLHDVYGLPYHYGNAIDWWNNPGELLNSFDRITDGSVKKGDFVIFNTTVGSKFGHIDVAMQDGSVSSYQGADSNWGGNLTVHLVQHSTASQVLGSLRLKEQDMAMTPEQVTLAYQFMVFRNPNQAELEAGLSQTWYDLETTIDQTDERKKIVGKVNDYDHLYQTAENAQNQTAALQKELDGLAKPTELKAGVYEVKS